MQNLGFWEFLEAHFGRAQGVGEELLGKPRLLGSWATKKEAQQMIHGIYFF